MHIQHYPAHIQHIQHQIYHKTAIFVPTQCSFTIHLPFGDSKTIENPDLPHRQREIGRVKGELLTGETTGEVLGKALGHVRYDEISEKD